MKFKNAFDSFNQQGVLTDDQAVEFGFDYNKETGEVEFQELESRSVRPEIQSFEKSCAMDFIKQQLLKEDKKGGYQQGDEDLEFDEAPADITEILQAAEMANTVKVANDFMTEFNARKEKKIEKEVDGNASENDDKAE